jgi:hypothetical protein
MPCQEAVILALQGSPGWELLSAKAMECLPAEEKTLSIQHCHQLFTKLQTSQLYAYNGKQSQYNVDTILETLTKMMHADSPCWDAFASNQFLKDAWNKFDLLCTFVPPGPDGKKVHGKEAIAAKLQHLLEHESEGRAVSLSDLDDFHVFHWLVDDASKAQVDALGEKVFQAAGAVPSAGSSSLKGKRVSKKQGGKDDVKSKKAKIESDSVLSLFG